MKTDENCNKCPGRKICDDYWEIGSMMCFINKKAGEDYEKNNTVTNEKNIRPGKGKRN